MDPLEKQTIETVKKIIPSVVSIVISKFVQQPKKLKVSPTFNMNGQFGLPLPEQILGDTDKEAPEHMQHRVKVGGGSGFIVDPDGLIVTNKHVVYDPDAEYTVMTSDGREFTGTVVSRDPINDVAMVRITGANLPALQLGNSDAIELGQTVIAVGNALGVFNNTVSKGIISGLSRKVSASLGKDHIENLRHVIQTDVAINQGNSGGPLVNLNGEVVGINTAVIYGAQNIGFAIPINWAKNDVSDLAKFGRVIRPYLGLRYVIINKESQEKYELPVGHGALVMKDHSPGAQAVVKGSPAEKAGIKENDIILSIDGKEVNEENEPADIIELHRVGDTVKMDVLRNDKNIEVKVTLAERK